MSIYQERLLEAQENDKIVCYNYINYKKLSGWWTSDNENNWHRPINLIKTRYNAKFLLNLPDYYFLGFPIKELLKNEYSNGHCHSCAVALSLCFKDFEIVTSNLLNYAKYCSETMDEPNISFEHTFLIIDIDDKKMVIDTSSSIITDYETYKYIFNPVDVRVLTSEQIRKTEPYQYLESLKNYAGPLIDKSSILENDGYRYSNILDKYIMMCDCFLDDDEHLTYFINRCLPGTINKDILYGMRCRFLYGSIHYEYPSENMYSLVDDKYDDNLYSVFDDTNRKNDEILKEHYDREVINIEHSNMKEQVEVLIKKFK